MTLILCTQWGWLNRNISGPQWDSSGIVPYCHVPLHQPSHILRSLISPGKLSPQHYSSTNIPYPPSVLCCGYVLLDCCWSIVPAGVMFTCRLYASEVTDGPAQKRNCHLCVTFIYMNAYAHFSHKLCICKKCRHLKCWL